MAAKVDASKPLPVALDVGNLMISDRNALDTDALERSPEEYLLQSSRDNLQLLVNELCRLPTTSTPEEGTLINLPPPTTALPRAKPIPKPKPLTRWEKFAKAKGIVKRKRSSHAYDEERQEWRPRHGRKSAKNDPMNDWITELN